MKRQYIAREARKFFFQSSVPPPLTKLLWKNLLPPPKPSETILSPPILSKVQLHPPPVLTEMNCPPPKSAHTPPQDVFVTFPNYKKHVHFFFKTVSPPHLPNYL